MTSNERAMLWKNYSPWFSNSILNIGYHSKNKEMVKTTYDALLFSKSLLLNTEREILNLITEEGNEENIKLYHSIADSRRELTKLYEFPLEEQRNRTDSIENFIKTAESQLINNCKAYDSYTKRLNVSWKSVANSLGEKDIAKESF